MFFYVFFIVVGIWLEQTYSLPNLRESLVQFTKSKPRSDHNPHTQPEETLKENTKN